MKRKSHKDHTLSIKWTKAKDQEEFKKLEKTFGFTGSITTRQGVRVGIKDTLRAPFPGQAGHFNANMNAKAIERAAKEARKSFGLAVAATIAHELGLHGIGGKSGHFHPKGYVDSTGGGQIGAVFSDEAADLIIGRLDMDDGDGWFD